MLRKKRSRDDCDVDTYIFQYPSISPLILCHVLFAVPSFPTPKVSRLARSSAFPSLDLELDATLTFVGRMRRDYSSTIFEYEIVHRLTVRDPPSRTYRRNLSVETDVIISRTPINDS